MTFIIGLLTFVLLLVCIALIFLVLIQLPKKEAGIGVAFGGGATDALFGAGSGTVLTKATKYAAVAFFALAVLIGWMHSHANKSTFGKEVEAQQTSPSATPTGQPSAQPLTVTTGEPAPLMSQPTTTLPPAQAPVTPGGLPVETPSN
jgi:preprotein translocase subunit SecG